MAVLVDIDEPNTIVAAIRTDDLDVFGQIKTGRLPALLAFVPFQNSLVFRIANDDFTQAVVVCVAQSHAVVPPVDRGSKRLVVQFEPLAKRLVLMPSVAIEMPNASRVFVADKNRGVAALLEDTKPRASV